MVDTDEVATGLTAFCPVILRALKLAMATAMAKATARAANNLELLQMLPELANDTLDIAPQAYRKQTKFCLATIKFLVSHLIAFQLKVDIMMR